MVDITGCARNTIRKYLRSDGKPAVKERAKRVEKLDPFKPYLIQRIESAKPDWIPASSLLEEIQNQGYEGGITRLRQFLTEYKPAPAPAEPDNRFETEPGKQMQVDWVVFRRGKNRLSAFVATMGYSRASFVEYVTDEKIETLLACHERAFEYFGGVPKQVLYDNMKTVVIERDGYGEGNTSSTRWSSISPSTGALFPSFVSPIAPVRRARWSASIAICAAPSTSRWPAA